MGDSTAHISGETSVLIFAAIHLKKGQFGKPHNEIRIQKVVQFNILRKLFLPQSYRIKSKELMGECLSWFRTGTKENEGRKTLVFKSISSVSA